MANIRTIFAKELSVIFVRDGFVRTGQEPMNLLKGETYASRLCKIASSFPIVLKEIPLNPACQEL